MNIVYIADFSLPNMSAYAVHTLKMCDALSEKKNNVELLIPHREDSFTFNIIKKKFLLKKKYLIKGFFTRKKKITFLNNLIFFFEIIRNFDLKKKLLISRSLIPSIMLAFCGYKIILEMHTEPRGITKFVFLISKKLSFFKNISFIFINDQLRKLIKIEKKNSIVLDDCADIRDFNKKKLKKKFDCVYAGSFVEGKGINTILKIAKKLKNKKFFLYGNLNTLRDKNILKKRKNVFFKGHISYEKIPIILNCSKILLMPYERSIGVLIKGIDVSKYISPLKLFDYLASDSIIIASYKKSYSHILKHKHNSYIVKNYDVNLWIKYINLASKKNSINQKIINNASITAKKYTWLSRAEKIIKFSLKG